MDCRLFDHGGTYVGIVRAYKTNFRIQSQRDSLLGLVEIRSEASCLALPHGSRTGENSGDTGGIVET